MKTIAETIGYIVIVCLLLVFLVGWLLPGQRTKFEKDKVCVLDKGWGQWPNKIKCYDLTLEK